MRKLATDAWWAICVVTLGVANLLLFLWFMFMLGFWSWNSLQLLAPLFFFALYFSYYLSAPLAVFGYACSMGFSLAKQTERAKLLAVLSGGALFNAIMVWAFVRF